LHDEVLFIDTSYVYALINQRDQWHGAALQWRLGERENKLLTTEFVLAEIADGLSSINYRTAAVKAIRVFQENSATQIIPASSHLFSRAVDLYEQRTDKNWGLTDCASFVVMSDFGLTTALTSDEHFRQAGFRALLLEE
jgi:uncharacterized protein